MSFTLQRIKEVLQKSGDYQYNNLCFTVSWPKDHLSFNQDCEVGGGRITTAKMIFLCVCVFLKTYIYIYEIQLSMSQYKKIPLGQLVM